MYVCVHVCNTILFMLYTVSILKITKYNQMKYCGSKRIRFLYNLYYDYLPFTPRIFLENRLTSSFN